jgi:tRNA 2-selenouridine synthase
MPVQKITIDQFLQLAKEHPVLDVRSPGEYTHAHIPGAHNLALFNDEERKIVGTAYKQQSREAAIKIGLDFFGVKMRGMVEQVEGICNLELGKKDAAGIAVDKQIPNSQSLLIHCWRGGMRSAGVAWLLDLYGFKVYTLAGGYKAYRKWVLAQFEKEYAFNIVGGYTGSGKTLLIHELIRQQKTVIDIEELANHKGSAFGAVGQQPKQEMFENKLAQALNAASGQQPTTIYLEDESQRIGNLQIPMPLWYTMRNNPVYFIDVPFEKRLVYITEEYKHTEKEKLVNNIIRIQKRLGGLETKTAINCLLENDYTGCFRILLRYYDKYYNKALNSRENLSALLNKIPCSGVDTTTNIQKLLSCTPVNVS